MSLGLLLVAAALCLTGYNIWDENRAGSAVAAVLVELDTRIPDLEVEPPPEGVIPDYVLNPRMEMPAVEVDSEDYIGRLEVPSLGLDLPVMSQWSYPNLKKSPCRYVGSAYLDNLVIAAHNYEHHFGGLKNLELGADVYFTDTDGNVFHYQVGALEQLNPEQVEDMRSSGWDLSLFTCTLGGQFRVTVRCDRVESGVYGLSYTNSQ